MSSAPQLFGERLDEQWLPVPSAPDVWRQGFVAATRRPKAAYVVTRQYWEAFVKIDSYLGSPEPGRGPHSVKGPTWRMVSLQGMLGNVPEAFRPPHVPSPSLASLAVGESVADFVGPLERPTHMEQFGRVLCGGGVGVATLHPIARAMAEAGNDVTTVIGARSKNLLMLEAELRSFSREVQSATDDGTAGHHGFVTEVVKQLLEQGSYDLAVVIGPAPDAEMSNAPSAGWTFRS